MIDREGVLETFSEGKPRLGVDLVQAWRFVTPCCHPQCQKASSPSQELAAPHHGCIADPAPVFSQCLNARCPTHLTGLDLGIDEIMLKSEP